MGDASLVMSLPEFARACSISRGLAYDLARRDALPVPVIRLGRRIMISRRAVEAMLEGGKSVGLEVSNGK